MTMSDWRECYFSFVHLNIFVSEAEAIFFILNKKDLERLTEARISESAWLTVKTTRTVCLSVILRWSRIFHVEDEKGDKISS